MKTTISNKSQKTIERINFIKMAISEHKSNIKLLNKHINNYFPPRKKNVFSPRLIKYTSLPKSQERFQFTLKNLTDQVNSLKKELAILIEYGA